METPNVEAIRDLFARILIGRAERRDASISISFG
jgi:hypothetical protein